MRERAGDTRPATPLRTGGSNDSGVTTLANMACIGFNFGGPSSPSDINGDSAVNTFNLVLARHKLDIPSPQPW